MESKSTTWQKRFDMQSCAAADIEQTIPANAQGVAVIYAQATEREKIFLVIESRAGALRSQCLKRLQTAKLPPVASLTISFKTETFSGASAEAVHEACRKQIILSGELRRELKPAMR